MPQSPTLVTTKYMPLEASINTQTKVRWTCSGNFGTEKLAYAGLRVRKQHGDSVLTFFPSIQPRPTPQSRYPAMESGRQLWRYPRRSDG